MLSLSKKMNPLGSLSAFIGLLPLVLFWGGQGCNKIALEEDNRDATEVAHDGGILDVDADDLDPDEKDLPDGVEGDLGGNEVADESSIVDLDSNETITPTVPTGELVSMIINGWTSCGFYDSGELWCSGLHDFRAEPIVSTPWPWFLSTFDPKAELSWSNVLTTEGEIWRFLPGPELVRREGLPKLVTSDGPCGVDADGAVWCWGSARFGQRGSTTDSLAPPNRIDGITDAVLAVNDWDRTCAILADGTGVCLGWNHWGQLGDGTIEDRSVPIPIPNLDNLVDISLGDQFSCALQSNGKVWCWGTPNCGFGDLVLEPGTTSFEPVEVRINSAVVLATGPHHACVVDGVGDTYCWGCEHRGQLGLGEHSGSAHIPELVDLPEPVTQVWAGQWSTCAKGVGPVYCWGSNDYGQLGLGSEVPNEIWTPTATLW